MDGDNHTINLVLTPAQRRKYNKTGAFQVTNRQIVKGGSLEDGDDECHEFQVHADCMKKLNAAHRRGKGYRFKQGDIVSGGSFKSFARLVKKHAGRAVEIGKKIVPRSVAKAGLDAALIAGSTFVGQPELGVMAVASGQTGKLVDAGYNHNFEKPLPKASHVAKRFVRDGAEKYVRDNGERYVRTMADDYLANYAQGPVAGGRINIGRELKNIGKKIAKPFVDNKKQIASIAGQTVIGALPGVAQPLANLGLQKGIDGMGVRRKAVAISNAVVNKGAAVRVGNLVAKPSETVGGFSHDVVNTATGAVTTGGRLVKGSQAAKDWAAKMQAARKAKRGGSMIAI